ncbi:MULTISPECIES: hypothetical protein [Streptomyces]|uniref:hypothetical protein n=1 Tax=Streptomyces TaxID=1883 RepID=UPI00278BD473|nr:hypothetical protein [Streptomyces hydrogenans]
MAVGATLPGAHGRTPGRTGTAAKAHGVSGVRLLIESWGLRWGIDGFDPPTDTDDQEHAAMQAGDDEPTIEVPPALLLPAARTFVEHVHRTRRQMVPAA